MWALVLYVQNFVKYWETRFVSKNYFREEGEVGVYVYKIFPSREQSGSSYTNFLRIGELWTISKNTFGAGPPRSLLKQIYPTSGVMGFKTKYFYRSSEDLGSMN